MRRFGPHGSKSHTTPRIQGRPIILGIPPSGRGGFPHDALFRLDGDRGLVFRLLFFDGLLVIGVDVGSLLVLVVPGRTRTVAVFGTSTHVGIGTRRRKKSGTPM